MKRINLLALALITVIVFIASSLWYSPLLFGHQFLKLSGVGASPHPNAVKALLELLRTFVLAYVIARLLTHLNGPVLQPGLFISKQPSEDCDPNH